VAGILDFLIKEKKIKAKKVVAYTWGNDNCRDVVYAKQISQRLDWEWKHFVVEHDDIKKNFKISAEQGCEYSGIHLHGIPKIALEQEVDLILAGSYGDSIGRAEYSGKHVKHIKPLNFLFYNFGSLLNYKCYKNVSSEVKSEIGKYHKLFPREKKYQQLELDYQLHYMRRMLNPCMAVINQKTPLFQVFTSPEVFGFMWSLNPEMRNNNIYTHLMEKFKTKLNDIPWSRTGKMFNSKIGVSDNYEKKTNSYSEIIQKDIVEKFSNTEISNGIINKHSFKKLLLSIQKANNYNFHYLEAICWVNSFSIFFRINNFKIFNRQINTIDLLLSFRAKLIYFIERLVWKTYIERIKK
jgi:asparagine synthase (glutamine-hydrolysing)